MGAAAIPFADDVRRGWVEACHPVQPGDTGVECQVLGRGVMPADVGCKAAHGYRPGKTAVDQERAALFPKG